MMVFKSIRINSFKEIKILKTMLVSINFMLNASLETRYGFYLHFLMVIHTHTHTHT